MSAKDLTERKEIIKQDSDASMIESVLLGGDLSKLSPAQRVAYYQKVCESLGLNPLTRPFDYLHLRDKLTLYCKKEAADQLRDVHGVSIDDVQIRENETQFVVTVKGHDKTGRTDCEVGVVNKKDMNGDTANAQMKAVTKAKRRLTLSLCGLGWLDETEVETIPNAHHVVVNDQGEIENPDPIDDKAWSAWIALTERAAKAGIPYPSVNREKTIKSDLREGYRELERKLKTVEIPA